MDMRTKQSTNKSLFVELSLAIFESNGYIDIMVDPNKYSKTYGMVCQFLNSPVTADIIKYYLSKHNIKFIENKNGTFRVVDNRTYTFKNIFKYICIIVGILLITLNILIWLHVSKILIWGW